MADFSAEHDKEELGPDIERTKERVLNINKNLKMELDGYARNRAAGMRRIMSYSCMAETEMGRKITEFATGEQRQFPQTSPTGEPQSLTTAAAAEEEQSEDKKEKFFDVEPM